ncbi:hypothetical protein EV360DRAFT_80404 [Lentinula raphanica]|nr:hypothetical protein EV360DRAFT_80404 [Lentinula raphanica]
MLLKPFNSRLSSSRLSHILLLAVCWLDTFVAARPVAVQELIRREPEGNALRLQINKSQSPDIKDIQLCLKYGRTSIVCSPTSSSMIWVAERISIGNIQLHHEAILDSLKGSESSEQGQDVWEWANGKMISLSLQLDSGFMIDDDGELASTNHNKKLMDKWKEILLDKTSTKIEVVYYEMSGHVGLHVGDEYRLTFSLSGQLVEVPPGDAKFLSVFTGKLRFRNRALMQKTLSELQNDALESKIVSDWFSDVASKYRLWDIKKPAPEWVLPWVRVDTFLTFLSEEDTGWMNYPDTRALTSQDLEKWVRSGRQELRRLRAGMLELATGGRQLTAATEVGDRKRKSEREQNQNLSGQSTAANSKRMKEGPGGSDSRLVQEHDSSVTST